MKIYDLTIKEETLEGVIEKTKIVEALTIDDAIKTASFKAAGIEVLEVYELVWTAEDGYITE